MEAATASLARHKAELLAVIESQAADIVVLRADAAADRRDAATAAAAAAQKLAAVQAEAQQVGC
jgi:hypothetical protein